MSRKQKSDKPKRARPPALVRVGSAVSPARGLLTLFCLTFAGLAEALGIASLLPLFAMLGENGNEAGGLGGEIVRWSHEIGLAPDVNFFLGFLIIGMLLKAGLLMLALRQVGRAAADVATGMRLELIEALLAARWSYYAGQPVGRLSNSFGTEANQAGEAYNAAAQLFSNVILVIGYLAVAALMSWKLAVLSSVVGLLMILTLNRFVVITKRSAKVQTKVLRRMIGEMTDVLGGIKPIKAMGRQAGFATLFRRDVMAINGAMRDQVFSKNANKALQEPILAICLAVGIYGAMTFWKMPAGEVLVMAVLLVKTVLTIGRAQQDLQNVRINESGYVAIADAIETARAEVEGSVGKEKPVFERAIEFRDVSFSYGVTPIISQASFSVPAGMVTALTGSSGSGKTTTVDIMLGLHNASAGEVFIDGRRLSDIDIVAWRQMIGYVPQELTLFHESIFANVTLGQADFSREDVERALTQAGAIDFVKALPEGLDTLVGERGARLSGGQRQRIAIARALLHRPRLLILDESTTALDPETEANIVRNLCALSDETGIAILAISHQPAWTRAASRTIRLEGGHILSQAPAATLGSSS
ncbi:ABC transporter ATP-binding protein [Lacibacterium aquatile]|uniref:ABC transporter ATP-binding protein n=1 Tax=Lacibacterium aquatile TaxID=1168082 RepID=A0ABW5DVU2_9PROT